jgi:hypothetical protein
LIAVLAAAYSKASLFVPGVLFALLMEAGGSIFFTVCASEPTALLRRSIVAPWEPGAKASVPCAGMCGRNRPATH